MTKDENQKLAEQAVLAKFLAAHETSTPITIELADEARRSLLTQLECLVGDDDARMLVMEAQEPPKATPAGMQKTMPVLPLSLKQTQKKYRSQQ